MGSLTFITTVGLTVAGLSSIAHAATLETIAPFPKPESGFTRQVIHLTPQTKEDDFQVEILAGKTLTWKVGATHSTDWKKSLAR